MDYDLQRGTVLDRAVHRHHHGAEILDEDDFAEHQVRYSYPPEVISQAEQAASARHAALL
jgi:uncharacterized protein